MRLRVGLLSGIMIVLIWGVNGAINKNAGGRHRLATFNVRYAPGKGDTLGRGWENRFREVAEVVRRHDFDVVGFQEPSGPGRDYRNIYTGKSPVEDLRDELKDRYATLFWDRDGNKGREFVGIAYKQNRYEALDSGSFYISPTPEVASRGWDTIVSQHMRRLGWIKLRDRENGDTFLFAATHTNNGWTLDGVMGARLVAQKLLEIANGLPVMLVADFNMQRGDEDRKSYRGYRSVFDDAVEIVPTGMDYSLPREHGNIRNTYQKWRSITEADYKGLEIDYHFSRGMDVHSRHIITDEYEYQGRMYPVSDHYPIVVEVSLQSDFKPRTRYVDFSARKSGEGSISKPFKTLQEALNVSAIGDTIKIAKGICRESVEPRNSVVIIGGYNSCFKKIVGYTIFDAQGLQRSPIYSPGPHSLTLSHCEFKNYKSPKSKYDGAIHFHGADLRLDDIKISNCSAQDAGGGICVMKGDKFAECNEFSAKNCIFAKNLAKRGGALAVGYYCEFALEGCDFTQNKASEGKSIYLTHGTMNPSTIGFVKAETNFNGCRFDKATTPASEEICYPKGLE